MEVVLAVSTLCLSVLTLLLAVWAVRESGREARFAKKIHLFEQGQQLLDLMEGQLDEAGIRAEKVRRLNAWKQCLDAELARKTFDFRYLRLSRRTAPRRTGEKLINRKCFLISLILPAPQRARYVEEWKDEWMAMRRGDIPKQCFHALRLIRGAVVQSYEERTEVRKQVD